MPPIFIGGQEVTKIYAGIQEVVAAYVGSQQVFSGFGPQSLFSSGEQGVWFDPSDLSTMFQDSAGTIPVTADGQPVGKILDKSGCGNHATAPNASSRPQYRTDGTYHWLQWDGVDDTHSTAPIDFTGTDKMSVFCGLLKGTPSPWKYFVGTTANSDTTVGSFGLYAPGGTDGSVDMYAKGSLAITNRIAVAPGQNIKITVGSLIDLATSVKVNVNGGAFSAEFANLGGNFANDIMVLGSRGDGVYKFLGNYYQTIVVGKLCTSEEIAQTEAFVNGKTGAY